MRGVSCFRAAANHIGETMFAVIRTGGKQYKVAKDDIITVEKLPRELGEVVEFAEVLIVGDGGEVATGSPLVAGAAVSATVVEQSRAAKIIVFKKKRRHNYRRKNGHRQYQTVLRIDEIRSAAVGPANASEAGAEHRPEGEAAPVIEAAAAEEGVSNGS
jgi:large subunit ribosomal protein L21